MAPPVSSSRRELRWPTLLLGASNAGVDGCPAGTNKPRAEPLSANAAVSTAIARD